MSLRTRFQTNSPLMKTLIKFMGILLGKILFIPINIKSFSHENNQKINILCQYKEIIHQYSNSCQKDFLRIAVIKSLKFCLPEIFEIVKLENFKLLLAYSRTFVRLLQDEIPEIRQKLANFLSKMLVSYRKTANLAFNFNFVLEEYLSLLEEMYFDQEKIYENEEFGLEIVGFFLEMIFESEFFKYKRTNYFDKRIFSFDKPNKFHDDMSLKRFGYGHLKKIVGFLAKFEKKKGLIEKIRLFIEITTKERKFYFLVKIFLIFLLIVFLLMFFVDFLLIF